MTPCSRVSTASKLGLAPGSCAHASSINASYDASSPNVGFGVASNGGRDASSTTACISCHCPNDSHGSFIVRSSHRTTAKEYTSEAVL
eukprot:8345-Pelagococcus_subviridis.AAC.1